MICRKISIFSNKDKKTSQVHKRAIGIYYLGTKTSAKREYEPLENISNRWIIAWFYALLKIEGHCQCKFVLKVVILYVMLYHFAHYLSKKRKKICF